MTDIEALRSQLSLAEKAALTAGGGMMSTAGVERVGIPVVNVTDGPSADPQGMAVEEGPPRPG